MNREEGKNKKLDCTGLNGENSTEDRVSHAIPKRFVRPMRVVTRELDAVE